MATKNIEEKVATAVEQVTPKKPRTFKQDDPILCRSVCPGWLGMDGKSGQYYVWENIGDVCEVEYGDLFAYKSRKSPYLYSPLIIIEDDELLENSRWKDIADFYKDQVYGKDDVDKILNTPVGQFKSVLKSLPNGLKRAVAIEAAERIENGTFDSIKKIKIMDEICDTDLASMVEF